VLNFSGGLACDDVCNHLVFANYKKVYGHEVMKQKHAMMWESFNFR
jgi:hypothetical protein